MNSPPHVPAGVTHLEYCLGEAERSFQAGQTKDGIASLAHAVHIAVGSDESAEWFRRIVKASGAWE